MFEVKTEHLVLLLQIPPKTLCVENLQEFSLFFFVK